MTEREGQSKLTVVESSKERDRPVDELFPREQLCA
jgi:hypothetical protein